jgi:hypothetical protein
VSSVRLDEESIERVALRVVELLDERREQLVDAATLAKTLGISRDTVYDHRAELGGIEVGNGERPRLRFDVDQARAAWTRRVSSKGSIEAESALPVAVPRRRRSAAARSTDGLLPIRGSSFADDVAAVAALPNPAEQLAERLSGSES